MPAPGGKEERWGWVVAFACFWTYLIVLGLQRSAAVVYVALLATFGVSRREAAWPVSVCSSTMFLVGPLGGALALRFSIRLLVSIGLILAAAGSLLCYFATNLTFIIIFFGIIQGIGDGMVLTLNPVIINQYFTTHRATAGGIAFAGASVGSIVLPPATEALIRHYGLRGCFLILGAINLQGLVGALLYREPMWLRRQKFLARQVNLTAWSELSPRQSSPVPMSFWERFWSKISFLRSPIFTVLCANYTSFFICYIAFSMTLVDFSRDQGVGDLDATLCISAFSAADLMGRLASGWVSDLGYMKRRTVLVTGLTLMGITVGLAPFAQSYSALLAVSSAMGLLTGTVIVLFPVLMTEFLGLEHLPMCLGISGFVMGVISLCLPTLIGAFRDAVGYYDNLYYTLSFLIIFSSLLWSFEPICRLYNKLRESLGTTPRTTYM